MTLEQRLQHLEVRNARLETRARVVNRVLGFGGVAVAGLAVLMGQAPKTDAPAKLKVSELIIVDDQGKTRVEIGVDKDGAGMAVRDAKGKARLIMDEGTIEGLGEGSGFWVMDEEERPRVGVWIGKKGDGPGLVVLDEKGKPVSGVGKP